MGEESLVDLGAADDEDLGLGLNHLESLGEGRRDIDPLDGKRGIAGEDDIAAAGELALGEGFVGTAAHDDRLAESEGLEVLEILADVDKLVAVVAYGAVAIDGGYEVNNWHRAMGYGDFFPQKYRKRVAERRRAYARGVWDA